MARRFSLRHLPSSPLAVLVLVAPSLLVGGCVGGPEEGVLRLGYLPNLTHAQALYGVATGLFERELAPFELRTTSFNSGSPALEALLARRIDVIYVGPSPTIIALERTQDVVAIIAGSASGGAMLVVQPDLRLESSSDYAGKRFASPQLGNTQDVALKHYLRSLGRTTRGSGGDVDVVNAANADILSLFKQRRIDGAWVPEPWATRIVKDAGGRVHVDESQMWPEGRYVTTHVVTTRAYLESHPREVEAFLSAHVEATRRIAAGEADVVEGINAGMERVTQRRLPEALVKDALGNIEFTTDPLRQTFRLQYQRAHDLGFSGAPPSDLASAYALEGLARVETSTAVT